MDNKEMPKKCEKCGEEHSVLSVKSALEYMPSEEMLISLSDLFKVFGDNTRIKILFSLEGGPLCVCEIADVLAMSVSAVSHQLKVLRQCNLIKSERKGKNVYYSLADSHVRDIIEKALEHLEE